MKQHKPLAITMGCPVGIGPEIILRLFERHGGNLPPAVVVGDPGLLERLAGQLAIPVHLVSWQPGAPVGKGELPVLAAGSLRHDLLQWGEPNLHTGQAMVRYIEQAVQLIDSDVFSGLVTCPISKDALHLTGSPYPGHTEMLADFTGADRYRMMMAGNRLNVVLVTIHEPLRRVSALLDVENIVDCIRMCADSLSRDFGCSAPKIGVAGLNPHSGENGLFGDEEQRIIEPAVRLAGRDVDVSGPWPPDTVFHRGAAGDFDAVIAMYHDQGLIPFKLLHFSDGVNVTLGLPIVRTSVDHGTAYDIAGQGRADCASLEAALRLAARIVTNRMKSKQKGVVR